MKTSFFQRFLLILLFYIFNIPNIYSTIVNLIHLKHLKTGQNIFLYSDVHKGFSWKDDKQQFDAIKDILQKLTDENKKCMKIFYEFSFEKEREDFAEFSEKWAKELNNEEFLFLKNLFLRQLSYFLKENMEDISLSIENRKFLVDTFSFMLSSGFVSLQSQSLLEIKNPKIKELFDILLNKFSSATSESIIQKMKNLIKEVRNLLKELNLVSEVENEIEKNIKKAESNIFVFEKNLKSYKEYFQKNIDSKYDPYKITLVNLLKDLLNPLSEVWSKYKKEKKEFSSQEINDYQNVRMPLMMHIFSLFNDAYFLKDAVDVNILYNIFKYKDLPRIFVLSGWAHTDAIKNHLLKLNYKVEYEAKTKNKNGQEVTFEEFSDLIKKKTQDLIQNVQIKVSQKHIFTPEEFAQIEKELFDFNLMPLDNNEFKKLSDFSCYTNYWLYILIALFILILILLLFFYFFKKRSKK